MKGKHESFETARADNVIELGGTDAAKERLSKAVLGISSKVSPSDILYIGLEGHGDDEDFWLNDGNGNNQNINIAIRYGDLSHLFSSFSPKEAFITLFSCGDEMSVSPLSNQSYPVIVANIHPHWIYNVSPDYPVVGARACLVLLQSFSWSILNSSLTNLLLHNGQS